MNVFCNEASCRLAGLESITFLYCCRSGYSKNRFVSGSKIFFIHKDSERFIEDVKKIMINEGNSVVLIDAEGQFDLAAKVFWGLKAAGFGNVRILIGEGEGLGLVDGEINEITKAESPYLPFNESVVMTRKELEKTTSFYQQLVPINSIDFTINEEVVRLTSPEIYEILKNKGVKFSQSRSSIVFGKQACFGGLLVLWATGKNVSVVIDEIEKSPVLDRSEKTDKQDPYSLTIDDGIKTSLYRSQKNTERDSAVCANCLLF